MSFQFKFDEFKAFFNCKYCSKLLVNPVALPCGVTVCESHVAEIIREKCIYCDKKHEKEYEINKAFKKMLELEIDKLKLNPKFENCKLGVSELNELVEKINLLQKDSENYIYEYFEEFKRKVDLRREDLKIQIDEYYDKVISDIDKTQKNLIKVSTELNCMNKNIEEQKKELIQLTKELNTFDDINDKKFENILESIDQLKPKMSSVISNHHLSLLNYKKYFFNFELLSIDRIFGVFFDDFPFGDLGGSKILYNFQALDLLNLCEFSPEQKWQLIYRASEHGLNSSNYYNKSHNVKNTLTIIKSTNGNIFGGYIESALTGIYDPNTDYSIVSDPNAFIFSLVNLDNKPFKAKCINSQCAARIDPYHEYEHGPYFGEGDIFISSNSNQNSDSYSKFGTTYINNDIDPTKYRTILAGSYNFTTTEIEVYTKAILKQS